MSIKGFVQSRITQKIAGDAALQQRREHQEQERRSRGEPHRITCYLRIDDPYSYLLSQCIPALQAACPEVRFEARVMLDLPTEMYPEPEMLAHYAVEDARHVARHHGLDLPSAGGPGDVRLARSASQLLLREERDPGFWSLFNRLADAYWRGDADAIEQETQGVDGHERTEADRELHKRAAGYIDEGHYLTAMLYYGGEWYWGVDRLDHLLARLDELGLVAEPQRLPPLAERHGLRKLPPALNSGRTLEFFFSFRSPYSYIALQRTFDLADHYGVNLVIRPVLPMVMRGLAVPKAKRLYIFTDTAREARCNDVPFGRACDPLGRGVENAMALYDLAREQGLERAYLLRVARAIWAEGVDVAKPRELLPLAREVGLDTAAAETALGNDAWREWAEANRQAMVAAGIWGVPSYRLDGLAIWGQDRFFVLEQALASQSPTAASA